MDVVLYSPVPRNSDHLFATLKTDEVLRVCTSINSMQVILTRSRVAIKIHVNFCFYLTRKIDCQVETGT